EQATDVLRKETLFGIQYSGEMQLKEITSNCVKNLIELGVLTNFVDGEKNRLSITKLGRGVVKGLIDIRKCVQLTTELKDALRSFNLNTKLHLIYVSTFLLQENEFFISPDADVLFDAYL